MTDERADATADMPPGFEVQTVTIGEVEIDAAKVICPECKQLWLDTDFDVSEVPWVASCPVGHVWGIRP